MSQELSGKIEDELVEQEEAEKIVLAENPLGKSRIGITKKIYREKAQNKAAKKAKKQRAVNRKRASKKSRPTGSRQRK